MNIGIFASDRNNLIGVYKNGIYRLPWGRLQGDLEHFRRSTLGKTLIAGRTTWDTLKSPLRDRQTYYLTNKKTMSNECGQNLDKITSIIEETSRDCYIVGGAKTFYVLAGYIEKFIITKVDYSHQLEDGEEGVYFDIGNHWKMVEETPLIDSVVKDNPNYKVLKYKIQTFLKK